MLPLDQKLTSNKAFGAFFAIIFASISLYFFYKKIYLLTVIVILLSILIAVITVISPNLLYRFNLLWFQIGILLGRIFNPLVMGTVYFFIFTPYSLLVRIFRRDVLLLKGNKQKSYWLDTKSSNRLNINFKNQY